MSQTLALIVAAMVLMMTALTVIFMTQGSLQDLFSGTQDSSCISTIKAQCATAGQGEEITTPASCDSVSRSRLDSVEANDGNVGSIGIGGTTTCNP